MWGPICAAVPNLSHASAYLRNRVSALPQHTYASTDPGLAEIVFACSMHASASVDVHPQANVARRSVDERGLPVLFRRETLYLVGHILGQLSGA